MKEEEMETEGEQEEELDMADVVAIVLEEVKDGGAEVVEKAEEEDTRPDL